MDIISEITRKSSPEVNVAKNSKSSAPAPCFVCKKQPDFCQCSVEVRARELLERHKDAIRARVLLEVADYVAGKAKEARADGKMRRSFMLQHMAETIAKDRMP